MYKLTIQGRRLFNEANNRFIEVKPCVLELEHSLLSIAKWETKWQIPFIESDNPYLQKKEWKKTPENMLDYIKCMTTNKNVDPMVYTCISQKDISDVFKYVNNPMSASFFADKPGDKAHSSKVTTSEYIYARMAYLGIPFSCEKWHLNRLLNLIRMASEMESESMGGGKKTGRMKTAREWAALNADRRKR